LCPAIWVQSLGAAILDPAGSASNGASVSLPSPNSTRRSAGAPSPNARADPALSLTPLKTAPWRGG